MGREHDANHEQRPSVSSESSFEPWLRDAARISIATPIGQVAPGTVTLAGGRLRLLRRIGAGGMGVVYEAEDRERNANVAVKLLSRLDGQNIYRLKNEFRGLVDLTHPNLVRLYELFAEDERWFFTMELVIGVPFDAYVGRGEAIDLRRLRDASQQIARGVQVLHRAGRVHRDLKPNNVLVTEAGRAVVLDFGLSVPVDAGGIGKTVSALEIVGTPAYMAPEQAAGSAAVEASDLYAMGIMLFETLTGELPFTGTAVEILSAKQSRDAPDAHPVRTDVPDAFAGLCARLLARSPRRRGTIDELLSALGSVLPLPEPHRAHPQLLFGRDAEMAQLRAAFSATAAGTPVLCAVSGPSGIGKTALVETLLRELERPAIVLRARCYERDRIPFKAIDPVVDALARHLRMLAPTEAAALLPQDIRALSTLFPALERVAAVVHAPACSVCDPLELRARAIGAFASTLARLRERAPLVIHIDDLHWACGDSIDFLRKWLTLHEAPPILCIVTFRNGSQRDAPFHAAPRAALGRTPRWRSESLTLQGLSENALTDLVLSQELGATTGEARAVAADAHGSPLFALRLLRRDGDGSQASQTPRTFGALLDAQLAKQTPGAQTLLELLALVGVPMASDCALEAASAERSDIEALVAAGLVHISSSTPFEIECLHDRVREHVYMAMPDERARAHASKLSEVLRRSADAPPELLMRCHEAAGAWPLAAQEAQRAGDAAAQQLAFRRAAAFFRRAIEVGTLDPRARVEVMTKLGTALARSGRGVEAATAYLEAARQAPHEQAIDLRRRAAEQLLESGHFAEGRTLLAEVCESVGLVLPRGQGSALWRIGRETAQLRIGGLTARYGRPLSAQDALRLDTAKTATVGLTGYAPLESAAMAATYLRLALKAQQPSHVTRALGLNAMLHAVRDPGRSWPRTLMARLSEQAEFDPLTRGFCALVRGTVAYDQGRFSNARAQLTEAISLLQQYSPGSWELDVATLYAQWTTNVIGDYPLLVRSTPALIEGAFERDHVWVGVLLSSMHGIYARLVPDERDASREQLARAEKRWKPTSRPLWPDAGLLLGEVARLIYEERHGAALDLLNARRAAFERGPLVNQVKLLPAFALYGGGCAAAMLRGETSRARRAALSSQVVRAARALQSDANPGRHGFGSALRAALALADGDADGAIAYLRRSLVERDAHHMAMYAAATQRRLGQNLGGDAGVALVRESEARMRGRGVKDVEAMTELLCPACRP